MKRKDLLLGLILSFAVVVTMAQRPNSMVFYNVENFFDTINDPYVNDDEFTPDGPNKWTGHKYYKKLENIEQVLFDIAVKCEGYPAVIGLSEVETRSVLEDIVATPKLAGANYRVLHYDSPERRGVDVAFLYRPDVFKVEGSKGVRSIIDERPDFDTRDILTAWGTIDDQPVFIMVAHWSSRWGGAKPSEFLRLNNARQMRGIADSVLKANPATRVIMMGDFNDDPDDKSIYEVLNAKGDPKKLKAGEFFNPYYKMLKAGYGTLGYYDAWNIFDNIVVTANMVDDSKGLKIQKSLDDKRFYGNIFKPSYLIQKSGRYAGYPFRSFSNGAFVGGYSDHLPVYILID